MSGKALLSADIITAVSNEDEHYKFEVVRKPKAGNITFINDSDCQTISSFTSMHLHKHLIYYVSNPSSEARSDSFAVVACAEMQRCSDETWIHIAIKKVNFHG